jgi:DNA-binding MarR family transcriptional regulator
MQLAAALRPSPSQATESEVFALPALGCACASVRRTARLITQLYGDEMNGLVEPAQFALLSALDKMRGAGQTALGRALGLDKTTLSRNLRVLKKNGWIELDLRRNDRRERGYRLTSEGKNIFKATRSGWLRAQTKLRAALPPGEWDSTLKMLDRAAEAALAAQSKSSKRKGKHA